MQRRISTGPVAGTILSEPVGTTQLPFLRDHCSENESEEHTKTLFEEVSATRSTRARYQTGEKTNGVSRTACRMTDDLVKTTYLTKR